MRLSGTKTGAINQYRGLGNQLWDLAGNRPSLDLPFADNKSLVDATTGANLVDFTRASSGTYVDSEGVIRTATTNEARFDHDPTTGESLGLLVEESRTNLIEYSVDISSWSSITGGSPTITSNATTAPDGTNTATLIENSSVRGSLGDVTSFTSGTTYTFSGYFKADDGDHVAILLYSSGGTSGSWNGETSNIATNFDLTSGTFTTLSGAVLPTTSTITDAGNGWWRCSITATATANINSPNQLIRNTNGATEGIYAWGYQVEVGESPTSYIPTTGAAATRAADVASISGSNFSSWYRQDEGTVFAEATPIGDNGRNQFVYVLAQGTGIAEEIFLLKSSGTNSITNTIRSSSNFEFNNGDDNLSPFGSNFKNAIGASSTSTNSVVNGVLQRLDTSVVMPTIDNLVLGRRSNNTFIGNFLIRRLTYWPARLPNETLQTITQ